MPPSKNKSTLIAYRSEGDDDAKEAAMDNPVGVTVVSNDDDEDARAAADFEDRRRMEDRRRRYAEAHYGYQERAVRRRGFAIPSSALELHHAKNAWGEDSWQMKTLGFINSDPIQKLLIALLILDVFILFTELALDAIFPDCLFVIRDAFSCCPDTHSDDLHGENSVQRLLSSRGDDASHGAICTSPLVVTDYQAGCDPHKYNSVHVAHDVLFWITIGILTTFEIELLFLIYLLREKFFHHLIYIVDFIIVTSSLVLELVFRLHSKGSLEVLAGFLIMFRLWRFVRIGHGLVASTYEIQEHKSHVAMMYIEELEERLKKYGDEVPERPKKLKLPSESD